MKRSGRKVVRLNEEEKNAVLDYVQKRPAGELTLPECAKLAPELTKRRPDEMNRSPENIRKILTYYVGQISAGKKPGSTASSSTDIFEKFQKELDSIVGRKIRSLRYKCRREGLGAGASKKEIIRLKKELDAAKKENAELKNVLQVMKKIRENAIEVSKLVSRRGIKKLL